MRVLIAEDEVEIARALKLLLITVGQTVLDCGRYELAGETDVLRLNKKEYQLMELFMKHPGQVFSTEHLMKQVWELDTEAGPDVVWTYMAFCAES